MSSKWILATILFVTVAAAPVLFAPPLGEIQQAWRATDSYASAGILERARAMQPYIRGRRDAFQDLSKGHLSLKFWGLPSPARSVYDDLLLKRFGVHATTVGGCVVMMGTEAEWAGYNDVMMREIERRHGRAALDGLWRDAEEVYRQRLARK